MAHSTSIEFEHGKGNSPSNLDDGETCIEEIEFDLAYEPADASYGADADGNRGMYVPGYFYPESDPPEKCEECGHFYSDEEKEEINKLMEAKANDYEVDPPEPDYDYPED